MALVPFPGSAGPARYEEPDDDVEPQDEEAGGAKMSCLEHLDELRKRLLMSIVSVGVGFVVALIFIEQVFEFIMLPLQATLPDGRIGCLYERGAERFRATIAFAAFSPAWLMDG